MSIVEPTGPLLFIDLLRGAKPPVHPEPAEGRKPYTPPTCTDIGTLDDLIYLRDTVSEHLPHLCRLAINGNHLFPYLPIDEAWSVEILGDMARLCAMLRALIKGCRP